MVQQHKVHVYLVCSGFHIALLQETHITRAEGQALQRRWRGQLFYTTYSAFARGVLIWIRAGIPFQLTRQSVDPEGRFVVVEGRLHGSDIMLSSVYAPNVDQAGIFTRLSGKLVQFLTGPVLMGGDFNTVADVAEDRSHPPLPDSPVYRLTKIRRDWQNRWGLIDSWRVQHPGERDYSFSALHELHVRLDTILCSPDVLAAVAHSEYLTRTLSDHNPLLIKIYWVPERSATPTWKLRPDKLEDPVFCNEVKEGITQYFHENEGTALTRALE